MKPAIRKPLFGAAGLAGGILGWGLLQFLFDPPPHILPSPWAVAAALGDGFAAIGDADENWVLLVASTFGSGLLGWLAGGLAGIVIGALLTGSRLAEELAASWIRLLGAPIGVAAAPLVLYWGGFGGMAKVLLAAVLVFFPVVRAAVAGLRAAPPGWHDVMRGFSASHWETFIWLRLPMALPGLCAALRRAWMLALVGVVIAEFLGAPGGLAAQISRHEVAFDLAGAIAGVLVFAVIGLPIAFLLRSAERGITEWIGMAGRA
jgi:ABC-type nitrate/sulfonate/bicarbonate transport system permease component